MNLDIFVRRILPLLSCLLAASISWSPDLAGASAEGELISKSAKAASGRRADLYRVPAGTQLLLKQVCVEHPAMYVEVGRSNDRVSYDGSGCTRFSPGYVVAGGAPVRCLNRSGQTRACTLIGTLTKVSREGARFFDVDEWLEDRSKDDAGSPANGADPQ